MTHPHPAGVRSRVRRPRGEPASGGTGVRPDARQLRTAAARAVAAVVLFAGAALVAHDGDGSAVRPYLVMAAAVVPHALLAWRALLDPARRENLAVRRRPDPVFGPVAAVLAGLAGYAVLTLGLRDAATLAAVLATLAAATLAVPPTIVVPRRARRSGTAPQRADAG